MYPERACQTEILAGSFTFLQRRVPVDCIESKFIIYLLHHPTSKYMYIGKSSTGLRRPREHSMPSSLKQYAHLPRSRWVVSLQKRGLSPQIVILEECAIAEDLDEAERFYIAYFRSIGGKRSLLNLTDGGEGILGYRHSKEEIERQSAVQREKAKDPEERKRLRGLSTAYWTSQGSREKKRQERTGKKWSSEIRAKMSATQKGRTRSPETRAKMSAAASELRRKQWADPAYREKQRQSQIASHGSEEYRAKAAEYGKLSSHETHRSEQYRAKQSEIAKVRCADPEVRARKSASALLKAQDPEYRHKLSEAKKAWWAKRRQEQAKDDLK